MKKQNSEEERKGNSQRTIAIVITKANRCVIGSVKARDMGRKEILEVRNPLLFRYVQKGDLNAIQTDLSHLDIVNPGETAYLSVDLCYKANDNQIGTYEDYLQGQD